MSLENGTLRVDCVCLLQALEQSLDSLALTSFGVMDTTLEEVFLKVSEEDQSLENSDAGETGFDLLSVFIAVKCSLSGGSF